MVKQLRVGVTLEPVRLIRPAPEGSMLETGQDHAADRLGVRLWWELETRRGP